MIKKTFTFIDESGALIPHKEGKAYFGIGAFKHTQPVELVERIHPIYEGLCAALKKDETRVEFSFKSTTASSIKYDLALIKALEGDYNWEFNCLYFDANNPNYTKPENAVKRWENYITYAKMLITKTLWKTEETIVIADYQRRPKISRKKFEFISLDIPRVYNALQTESHGVLCIQIADLLLGGFLYSLNPDTGDKEGNKTRIANQVLELKKKVGKNKFNCWEVNWSKNKSSRIGRV